MDLRPSENLVNGPEADATASALARYGAMQSMPFEAHDEDSIERETILGMQLTNPYLIPNMQQAYTT